MDNLTSISAQEAWKRGEKSNLFKVAVAPLFAFVQKFLLQGGILDGYHGFLICKGAARYKFMKYSKLRKLGKSPHSSVRTD